MNQGQFSDPDFISGTHQRENVQFTDKLYLCSQSTLKTDIYCLHWYIITKLSRCCALNKYDSKKGYKNV